MAITVYYGKHYGIDFNDIFNITTKGDTYTIFYRYINGMSITQEMFRSNSGTGFANFVCDTINKINSSRSMYKKPEIKSLIVKEDYNPMHVDELKSYIKQNNLPIKLVIGSY